MKRYVMLMLCIGSFSVNAAVFQGTSTGSFDNPVGSSNMVATGTGTDTLTWGMSNGQASSLSYTSASFDVDENDSFVFGTLYYYNGVTVTGTDANEVDLNINLAFTAPDDISEEFSFNLGLINTPNKNVDPDNDADIVSFDNSVPSNFFSFEGVDYTLEFLGFGTLTGSGFTVDDSFRVLENGSASVDLVGRITSTPAVVPVPAAVWLFGSGLLGLYGVGKRRKKQNQVNIDSVN
jgi:hypothetical protein